MTVFELTYRSWRHLNEEELLFLRRAATSALSVSSLVQQFRAMWCRCLLFRRERGVIIKDFNLEGATIEKVLPKQREESAEIKFVRNKILNWKRKKNLLD